ncbi:MAG: PAS domain-containing protein [Bacteroidales bacterium]|nr:PAS domain-containing protein [Bacteroidales bacterium]
MKRQLQYNYIDFAKAIGPKRYILSGTEEIDLQQILLENPLFSGIFNVGPYFILLGNVKTWETLYISEGVEKITGYTIDDAISLGPQFLVNFTHPEDYPVAMETNSQAVVKLYDTDPDERKFLSCLFYHRGVHRNGHEMNIMQQIVPVKFDLQGNPYIFAILITDISHLQMPRIPKTVLIDHKRNDYQLIEPGKPFIEGVKLKISRKEKEVLKLLSEGLTTKEIAAKLGITFHTAATYRKRLRTKTGVKNTTELVNFALLQSLL